MKELCICSDSYKDELCDYKWLFERKTTGFMGDCR